MKLILVRHAEAVPIGFAGVQTDFDRFLTDLGKRQSLALAEALHKAGVTADVVVTSPLVRAVQTPALVIHGGRDGLVPVGSAREAAALHPNWKLVVLGDLGHIPQMEAPARWLAAVEGWLDELVVGGERDVSAEDAG